MGYAWGSPDGPLPWVSKQEFYLDSPAQVQLLPIHSPNCCQRGVLKTPIFSHFLAYNISTTPSGFQAIVPGPQPKPPVSSRRPSPSSPAPCSQRCHFTSAKLPVVLGSDWVCLFPTLNTPTPQPHNPETQLWYCPSSLRLRGHRTLPSPPRAPWSMGAQPTTQHRTAPPIHSRLLLWATKSAEWADVKGSLLAMEITGDRSARDGDLPIPAIDGIRRWCGWDCPGRKGPEEIQGSNGIEELRTNSQSHGWKVEEKRLSKRRNNK